MENPQEKGLGGGGGLGCGLIFGGLAGLSGTFWPFRGFSGFGIPRDWGGRGGRWGRDGYRDTLGCSPPVSPQQEFGEGVTLHWGGSNPSDPNGFLSEIWDPLHLKHPPQPFYP